MNNNQKKNAQKIYDAEKYEMTNAYVYYKEIFTRRKIVEVILLNSVD